MGSSILIEPLWLSLKCEAISLHGIAVGFTDRRPIRDRVVFCDIERPYTAPDGRTPAEVYRSEMPVHLMNRLLRALPTSPQALRLEDRSMGILAAGETTGPHRTQAAKLSDKARSAPHRA